MEELLHYVWKHRIFPLNELTTTTGQRLEIIDTGLANRDAGPDFFNAKIKIEGVVWVGNIEIHRNSSDWFKHGHHQNPVYNNVILHIATCIDTEVYRSNGESIPQMQLDCPKHIQDNFKELANTDQYPPCYRIISSLSNFTIHSWMSALQMERFEQKYTHLIERLRFCNNHWEDAFFITLARNFGFSINADAFEEWAKHIPLRAIDKHRDNLFQIEAFFFGQAGKVDGLCFFVLAYGAGKGFCACCFLCCALGDLSFIPRVICKIGLFGTVGIGASVPVRVDVISPPVGKRTFVTARGKHQH